MGTLLYILRMESIIHTYTKVQKVSTHKNISNNYDYQRTHEGYILLVINTSTIVKFCITLLYRPHLVSFIF